MRVLHYGHMKNVISAHRVGLAFGGVLGLWHLAWSVMVALGIAQPFMDWILQLHMIELSYRVLPFAPLMALGLIIVTSAFGYIIGYVLGTLWNAVQK